MITLYLSKNLRFLRKQRKLSQTALAEALSLSRSNIAAYEAGNSEPNLRKLIQLTDYFNVSTRDFITKDLENQATESNTVIANLDNKIVTDLELKTTEAQEMLLGFKRFFRFRMKRNQNPSKNVLELANDFENLLDVTEDLITTNQEIIKTLT
ncbi:MAG: helix-turn-helix domain-containing protein [Saprospiraceae bacterium]